MISGAFSLTPALPRWERGNCFQRLCKMNAASGSNGLQLPNSEQLLFPLPAGEGQGEGESYANPMAKSFPTPAAA